MSKKIYISEKEIKKAEEAMATLLGICAGAGRNAIYSTLKVGDTFVDCEFHLKESYKYKDGGNDAE